MKRGYLSACLSLVGCLSAYNADASTGALAIASKQPQLVIDAKGLVGEPIVSVDISSDGKLVAAASGKEVRVWTLADGALYATLRGYREPGGFHVGTINVVRFFPGTHQLGVAVSDNTEAGSTRIYDLARPDEFYLVEGHVGCTRGLAIAGDGQRVVTFGCDGYTRVARRTNNGGWLQQYSTSVASMNGGGQGLFDFVDDTHLLWLKPNYQLAACYEVGGAVRNQSRSLPGPIAAWLRQSTQTKLPITQRAASGNFSLDVQTNAKPWSVMAGTAKLQGTRRPVYWAGAWDPGNPQARSVYQGHNYHPTATTLRQVSKPVKGQDVLAATGDKLGEVHVWLGNNAEPIARFKPRNRQFYGVSWGEDGRSVRLAATPYPHGEYQYNHYGPTTHEFHLGARRLTLASASPLNREDAARDRLTLRHEGDEFQIGIKDKQLQAFQRGTWTNLNPWKAPRAVRVQWRFDAKHFGNPYCYVPSPAGGGAKAPRILVGSDTGMLEEFEVLKLSTGDRQVASERRFIGHTATVTGISISPDGRSMATCGWDGTVRFWPLDLPPRNGVVDFAADGTSITRVRSGSRAEAAGLKVGDIITKFDGRPFFERFQGMAQGKYQPKQTVSIDYLRNGQPRRANLELVSGPEYIEPYLTIFFANDDEWIAYTPKGYYDASPGGEKYIGWHINRQRHETALFYGVEQFRESLYRPDIIDAVFAKKDEATAVQVAEASLVTPAAPYPDVAGAPEVKFTSPASPHFARGQTVEITLAASSPIDDPIRGIKLRVAGRPAGEPAVYGAASQSSGRQTTKYRATLDLPTGASFVTAIAETRTASSAPAQIEVRRPQAAEKPDLPQLFVLAVGISEYDDEDLRLRWAGQDARDFAAAWKSQEGKFYASVETRVVADVDASVEKIRDGMAWLAKVTRNRPYDVAMVYFAGHGVFNDRGRWYFGGRELDLDRLRNTALPQSELVDLIDEDLTCRTLLFADTCHAAAFRDRAGARRSHPQGQDPWMGWGCMCMVSCTAQQQSFESDVWQNGAFTESLIATLKSTNSDSDRDGRLSFDEITSSVKRRTKQLAQQLGAEQTPAVQLPSFVSDVFLATAP